MTLKNIIKKEYDTFVNGVAWIVIYKINRSWNYSVFYHKYGDYEDGLIFDNYDKEKMFDILKADPKAICVNGIATGFGEDFTVSELEDKIRMFYIQRYHQLNGDFLGRLVENVESNVTLNNTILEELNKEEIIEDKHYWFDGMYYY